MFRLRMFVLLFLATIVALTGCAGGKRGDVLPMISRDRQGPNVPITIAVHASGHKYGLITSWEYTQVATEVFRQYGWRVTNSEDAQLTINLSLESPATYAPAINFLAWFGTGFFVPLKGENYIQSDAVVSLKGAAQQENFSYTGSFIRYVSLTSPIAIMIPGVTETFFFPDTPTNVLMKQVLETNMQHIAEDIKAKYLSGNFQQTNI